MDWLQAYGLVGGLAPESADLRGAAALAPTAVTVRVLELAAAEQVGCGGSADRPRRVKALASPSNSKKKNAKPANPKTVNP